MPKIWQNLKNINHPLSNMDPRDASASKKSVLSHFFPGKVPHNDMSESRYRSISIYCWLADHKRKGNILQCTKCVFKISSQVLSNFCAWTLAGRRQGELRPRSFMVFRKSRCRHPNYFYNTGKQGIGILNVFKKISCRSMIISKEGQYWGGFLFDQMP